LDTETWKDWNNGMPKLSNLILSRGKMPPEKRSGNSGGGVYTA